MALLVLFLAGCTGDTDELRTWMADQRKDIRPITSKIPEPKKFEPYQFNTDQGTDPFSPQKLIAALKKLSNHSSGVADPTTSTRRREQLEDFPLDQVSMVGFLDKAKLRYGLVSVAGHVYPVTIGNYVGQNFGIVTNISESQVTLKETVQDAAGEWTERVTTLQLREGK